LARRAKGRARPETSRGRASARRRDSSPVASGLARAARPARSVETALLRVGLTLVAFVFGKACCDAVDADRAHGYVDRRDGGFGEGDQRAADGGSLDLDYVTGAEILHSAHLAEPVAVLVQNLHADEVGVVELFLLQLVRQRGALDEQLGPVERLGGVA